MKAYNTQYGIGTVKYAVNYHDGEKKHKDGSPFWDIATFGNIKKMKAFISSLEKSGYIHESLVPSEQRYPKCNRVAEEIATGVLRSIYARRNEFISEEPYSQQGVLELVISKLEKQV